MAHIAEKFDDMCIHLDTMLRGDNQGTDRRTDRRTEIPYQHRAPLCWSWKLFISKK